MPESDRETAVDHRIDRRTVLKGAAVAGLFGATGIASANDWREIAFVSASDGLLEYWLEVSGEVRRGGAYPSDDGDEVGENTVHGKCAEGRRDSFLFTGESVDVRTSGPGQVLLDGELYLDTTEDRTTEGGTTEETTEGTTEDGAGEDGTTQVEAGDLPRVAIVSSPETDELLEYTFEVTGDLVELEPDEDSDRAVDEVTDLDEGVRVEGAVNTGDDRYAFSGELVQIDIPQGVLIEVVNR